MDTVEPDGDTGSKSNVEDLLGTDDRPRWRRWMKYWLPALLIASLLFSISMFSGGDEGPKYITEKVQSEELDLSVTATGNLRPTNQVEIGSEVSGRIDDIRVEVNDRVARGQIIAIINTEVIDEQIVQASANLNASRAQVRQAQATLEFSKAQLTRFEEVFRLSEGKVPSQVELEQARAAVRRDQSAVAAASANARAAEAQLGSARVNLDRAVIRSPVAGVVLARRVEPGQTVIANFSTPTLFVIAEDLSAMQLRVSVDEADVGQVTEGQEATFTVDAYPGERFPALVERVDQASRNIAEQAGQQSAAAVSGNSVVSYEARLSVDNSGGKLRPGMTATATISTGSTGKRLLVPNSALRFKPDAVEEDEASVLNPEIGLEQREQEATIGIGSRQIVHVLTEAGELEPIEVTTGSSDGRRTVVSSPELKAGMEVVTGQSAGQ